MATWVITLQNHGIPESIQNQMLKQNISPTEKNKIVYCITWKYKAYDDYANGCSASSGGDKMVNEI
jgi:hypothetical protein